MTPPARAIDAYAHVGTPRFGSAREVLAMFDRWEIAQGVLVMGPGVPDFAALVDAFHLAGERVRGMGIPFGATAAQRRELARAQIAMGISGMRLMPAEVEQNPAILDMLGERGLWLYAINPHERAAVTRLLLAWLDRYPQGRIAAPHFLMPQGVEEAADDPVLLRRLLEHPRFVAIFSRQGAAGGLQPYPYPNLRRWVQEVSKIVGWERIMWGSEHPVIYWRNEQIDTCWSWIEALGVEMGDADRDRYFFANAQRLLFAEPGPPAQAVRLPSWVEAQFDRDRTVPLLPNVSLDVPMPAYRALLSDYLRRSAQEPGLSFADYLAEQLVERARQL